MTRKEKIRLIRVLGVTSLFVGGVVVGSYVLPKIKMEPSEVMETVKENFKESDLGERAFKILGANVDKEVEEENKEDQEDEENSEEEEGNQSFVQDLKENIEKAVIETSNDKVIDVLEALPSEEFEKLKKDFCPKFCEQESN
ncbi:hypothetical protein ISS85_03015 [Candidatus Microgenomates bacterium]|nr:hypothetical protein [Candidatus Microgenomates bacterium]